MKDIKASKQSSFLKAPIRILTKAKDFYIRSFSECSGHFDFSAGLGCPTVYVSTLPKSSGVSSSMRSSSGRDNDFSELARSASTRGVGKMSETELLQEPQLLMEVGNEVKVLPRSQSLAIGRIDEDSPCDFGDDIKLKLNVMYPRSRSHTPFPATNGLF